MRLKIKSTWSIALVGLLLTVTSCFEEQNFKVKDQWIYINTNTLTVPEGTVTPVRATFVYAGALRDEAITITYSLITEDAVAGADYTLSAGFGTATIPAGETTVTVDLFSVIDNSVADGDKTFDIQIETADDLTIGFPGPDQLRKGMAITVEDDDCAFDLSAFVGSYEVELNNANAFLYPSGVVCCLETTLTLGATPNTLVDPDFYGVVSGGLASANDEVTIVFDPGTLTTALNPSPQFAYLSGANGRQFEQQAGNAGSISTCTTSFTVKIIIRRQNDNSVAQTATLTYTKL